MALDAAEWRFASEFAWDDGGTTSPPLDTQPDDLIELIGSYSSDVLEPSHLGRLARTSTCMRRLLEELLETLRADRKAALLLSRKVAPSLADFLRERPTAIFASGKNITEADAPTLGHWLRSEASSQLELLNLSDNPLGSAGADAIAAATTTGSQRRLKRAGGLKHLRSLFLSGTELGVDGMRHLAACIGDGGLPSLEWLFLGNNAVGDDGAKALAEGLAEKEAPALKTLHLADNGIRDAGIVALMATAAEGKLASIEELVLEKNRFGDAGADALTASISKGSLPKLKYLKR